VNKNVINKKKLTYFSFSCVAIFVCKFWIYSAALCSEVPFVKFVKAFSARKIFFLKLYVLVKVRELGAEIPEL
jgi:hypothetical protein